MRDRSAVQAGAARSGVGRVRPEENNVRLHNFSFVFRAVCGLSIEPAGTPGE